MGEAHVDACAMGEARVAVWTVGLGARVHPMAHASNGERVRPRALPIAQAIVFLALAFISSCRGVDTSLMPLAVGHSWTYEVKGRKLTLVKKLSVSRTIAVDDVSGYELTGPLGIDRLAWRGSRLVAETLAGTHFDPPIPLLDARDPRSMVLWSGTVTSPIHSSEATASLNQKMDHAPVGSHETPALESILELRAGNRVLELDTWFVSGIGIVRQEERSDGLLTVRLSRMDGP